MKMTGKILEFNRESNKGVIVSPSGNKYPFHIADYKVQDSYPKKNSSVEFILEEERAIFIYPISEEESAKQKEKHTKSSMYAKVSLLSGILGIAAFVYFAYNSSTVEKGYLYTIPSLFAILTGHVSKKSKTASLGLSLGYIVTMMYLIIIAVASFLL